LKEKLIRNFLRKQTSRKSVVQKCFSTFILLSLSLPLMQTHTHFLDTLTLSHSPSPTHALTYTLLRHTHSLLHTSSPSPRSLCHYLSQYLLVILFLFFLSLFLSLTRTHLLSHTHSLPQNKHKQTKVV